VIDLSGNSERINIEELYPQIRGQLRPSHRIRIDFALLLMRLGFSDDQIIERFHRFADFDETITRYHLSIIKEGFERDRR